MLIGELWRTTAARLAAAGIAPQEAQLEAEVLLRHVLGLDRSRLLLARGNEMGAADATRFEEAVRRRQQREPLAYITGRREFYGLEFVVDRRVLIPRPTTEGLVERALHWAEQRQALTIADVGAGSGCIAVALAVHLPQARIWASDVSTDALTLAEENAQRHQVKERIFFVQGDLLAPLPGPPDVLVSNPPYVASAELAQAQPELAYEPQAALDGGPDGLAIIRRLLAAAPACLRPGGLLLVEIGAGQGEQANALAQAAFPHTQVRLERDLAGLERYLIVAV